ncbi:hypothetical protein EMIHUDRAFT_98784 [Emiliania huxleyi CCMP1516]|uniref:Uncharacterized protein n=2 Tax=Emiliania huxleyi TaxID=2903 RepID=A0A0D3KBE7_EMIH1|nr:hypothetical protein EMIHUDRAFT_98784 [Emiliania huxleyi CCMP1516]EOD33082.1 hypothetical protein EMIHUDRAFT_98784 [Emiliania huxleyi CCMP1516]|eukprot:XP_005785511.1 hypothetical protein EMIHUDRAFT_98784 [Emiliania huxleyi CCMP1516]
MLLLLACSRARPPLAPAASPLRASAPQMVFGPKLPPEVAVVLRPAYEGAARGGEPFVVGTEAELRAIWSAMLKVYGNEADARLAVARNQQVILPYINSPAVITGAHRALLQKFGAEDAAKIIRQNPGILACDPAALAATPSRDIESAASFVAAFDSLPRGAREGVPFATFALLAGTIGARLATCAGRVCGSSADWDLKGGLGVQAKAWVLAHMPM